MQITTIGLDIAKNVFQIHGIDAAEKVIVRKQLRRCQVTAFFEALAPCLVGMEACVGAHHLSRRLKLLGHDARLMPAKYVRPYSKGQKNDFRDAEAIAEAVQRPTMKFVATKTADQLDLQALHRVRERLVGQRTGIINQIRAFLLERGVAVRQGLRFLRGHTIIMSIFGVDFLAMIFGMPRALFPALAERLGGGAALYGLLISSVAAGAFLASLVSGWTARVQRQGRAVLIAISVWGTAIAVAGLVRVPAIVMVALAVAGACYQTVFRNPLISPFILGVSSGAGFGAALAGLAGILAGPIYNVQPGMGELILIQVFVVIVIGGIGSIRGALVGSIIVGVVDTMGRAFLKPLLSTMLTPTAGEAAGPALASILIYLLMAAVLTFRPQGLFGSPEVARA